MHLLVVDDDETILQLVSIYLEQAGYNVKKASNAEAALAFLQKQQFDLIIIDVMMPGMDGYSLANIVNKEYGIPIIMLPRGRLKTSKKALNKELMIIL